MKNPFHPTNTSESDDHLEDSIYQLIQAAVTYIRRNEQHFDLNQLHECYRQRHCLRMNYVQ